MNCHKCGAANAPHEHMNKWYCDDCIREVTIPAEVWSRVVGYMRPVSGWNDGKRQEFADRRSFDVAEVLDEGTHT